MGKTEMWVPKGAGTCEHQISHDFSIKLRQEQLAEHTPKKNVRRRKKSFAQIRKDQENRRKSKAEANEKKEKEMIAMTTVQLEVSYNYPYCLQAYPGVSTVVLVPPTTPHNNTESKGFFHLIFWIIS